MGQYDEIMNTRWDGVRLHPKMNMQDRAKIFLPFAALKGYEEAIEEKQKIYVPKKELTEDMIDKLDKRLGLLLKLLTENQKIIVKVTYYFENKMSEGEYLAREGMLVKIASDMSYLQIVNDKIPICDVKDIEGDIFQMYGL